MALEKIQIKPITGMRGIAALGVLFHHTWIYFMPAAGNSIGVYTELVRNGYLWVDFFFILSGFLLCVLYFDKFSFAASQLKSFWIYRFARIYPLHIFILLLFVAVQLAYFFVGDDSAFTGRYELLDLLKNVFLLQAFQISPGGTTWNGPAWSISAEWVAYLSFPLFVLILRRVASAFASAMVLILCLAGLILIEASSDFQLDVTGIYGLLRCGLEFLAGMILARQFYRMNVGMWLAKPLHQLVILIALLLSMHVDQIDVITVVLMAIFILSIAHDETGIAKILSYNWLIFIGEISYAIYMTHWFVFLLIEKAGTQLFNIYVYDIDHWLGWLVVSLLVVASVIVFSSLSYRFVERPMRSKIPSVFGAYKF